MKLDLGDLVTPHMSPEDQTDPFIFRRKLGIQIEFACSIAVYDRCLSTLLWDSSVRNLRLILWEPHETRSR